MHSGFSARGDGFTLQHAGRTILAGRPGDVLRVARGAPDIAMYRGNFRIEDQPSDLRVADRCIVAANRVDLLCGEEPVASLQCAAGPDGVLRLEVSAARPEHDRLILALPAGVDEAVWGGGEQMSYLRLNGRRYPIWTSEPGVGRDKSTALTREMDRQGMAGGDYWTTNYPQPTFLSSAGYLCHLDETCYAVLDFTDPAAHRIEMWAGHARLEFACADMPAGLVAHAARRFGPPAIPPAWALGGAIVGLKDGARSFERFEAIRAAGAAVSALWCEDWCGIRQTSFGRRLFWDWRWNPDRYPDLPARIDALRAEGLRFLGYVNPYIAVDAALFAEAEAGGHLALRLDTDEPYLVDFGEFDCGVVDLTRADTRGWFADRVIGREMLDFGLSGWMADFGEYLPVDLRLAGGTDPMTEHNRWPLLWAQTNAEAVASRGAVDEALFFMRAGAAGLPRYCPLLWAGDQSVDFTRHDGIGTVVTAALSAGLVGNAFSHSDCGGYTSLLGNVRTAELMQRWYELAAFAPVMRTHEGNRPDDNLQIDSTPELLAGFVRWSRVHAALAPYVATLVAEAQATGLPVQRALFLHHFDEAETWPEIQDVQDQFLYGADLLVAPVIEEGARARDVLLPGTGPWHHVWSGKDYPPGWHRIEAPLGEPPVFYRPDSPFAALFASLRDIGPHAVAA